MMGVERGPIPPTSCGLSSILFLPLSGVRSFSAQPILSADNPGDKHKVERFLLPGERVTGE